MDEKNKKIISIYNSSLDDFDTNEISLKKSLLAHHPCVTVKCNLQDTHLYVFNYAIVEYLMKTKKKFEDLKVAFKQNIKF